jgi:menaquinone-dependent protoporphyrinogen oxidase
LTLDRSPYNQQKTIEKVSERSKEQMAKRVLIASASKYGATTGIAERISEVIQNYCPVTLSAVEDAPDPSGFQYIVLGSAVYIGKWRKEAERYLIDYSDKLSERMVWFFSSGPTGTGDPVKIMKDWTFPQNLKSTAARIKPEDIVFFHGALDLQKCTLLEKILIRSIKAPIGDFRDWKTIETWAHRIGQSIHG